jgi:hypothetical protein
MFDTKKLALFLGGVVFGSAGFKVLSSKDAKKVYTQTTDVEGEVNGLFTYDRKVMKVLPERLKAANKAVIESMPLDME